MNWRLERMMQNTCHHRKLESKSFTNKNLQTERCLHVCTRTWILVWNNCVCFLCTSKEGRKKMKELGAKSLLKKAKHANHLHIKQNWETKILAACVSSHGVVSGVLSCSAQSHYKNLHDFVKIIDFNIWYGQCTRGAAQSQPFLLISVQQLTRLQADSSRSRVWYVIDTGSSGGDTLRPAPSTSLTRHRRTYGWSRGCPEARQREDTLDCRPQSGLTRRWAERRARF